MRKIPWVSLGKWSTFHRRVSPIFLGDKKICSIHPTPPIVASSTGHCTGRYGGSISFSSSTSTRGKQHQPHFQREHWRNSAISLGLLSGKNRGKPGFWPWNTGVSWKCSLHPILENNSTCFYRSLWSTGYPLTFLPTFGRCWKLISLPTWSQLPPDGLSTSLQVKPCQTICRHHLHILQGMTKKHIFRCTYLILY